MQYAIIDAANNVFIHRLKRVDLDGQPDIRQSATTAAGLLALGENE
jgi:hypothetical protein